MSTAISIRHVTHSFPDRTTGGDFVALDDVSLEVPAGELLVLVGPSGCGKSTLLDLVAGLSTPASGELTIDGRPITGPGLDRGV
ncbi:MAG: ATP-binding cassette domain-containing protein, partial [Marmoricola sp.]|nr:ATP-binding cassette domain-containing protein [Marmoricola sp.]